MWIILCKRGLVGNFWVGSYLLLNTLFHWLYSVVPPIVFCSKSIVIFVRSIDLLANPEAHSTRNDPNCWAYAVITHKAHLDPQPWCERHGSKYSRFYVTNCFAMQSFFENRNTKKFVTKTRESLFFSFISLFQLSPIVHFPLILTRIDPCPSHHVLGSKLFLVLPSLRGLLDTEKAKFYVTMVTYVMLWMGEIYNRSVKYLSLGEVKWKWIYYSLPSGLFRTNLQCFMGDLSQTACYAVYNYFRKWKMPPSR